MLIFILDMGRVLFLQQYLSERARFGARWASVNVWNPATVANIVCYDAPTAPNGDTSSKGVFGLSPSMVTASREGTAGTWDDRVVVRIGNYPLTVLVPFIAGQYIAAPVSVTLPMGSGGASN